MSKKHGLLNAVANAAHDRERARSSKKYSPAAEEAISDKMDKMKNEDRPQDQKVAIAMSEARRKGLKVPAKK